MLRRCVSRIPSSVIRSSPSSLLSSTSSPYSSTCSSSLSSSSSLFLRSFSSTNNEKESKQTAKPNNAHLAAAAAAAFLPSAYISLSRDHLLRQADLPEYTRKWPQLWQLTTSELKQNNTALPYPQPPSAAAIYERFSQGHQASSSSSASSSSIGLTRYNDWVSDENLDELDLDEDEDDEDLTLSQLDEVEAALAEGEEREFTVRLDRVESSVSKLNEKLHQLQTGTTKRTTKALALKQTKSKAKSKVFGPNKRVGRPKRAAVKAMAAAVADLQQASIPPPSPAELAAFISASPARAQLLHQVVSDVSQESVPISSVALTAESDSVAAKLDETTNEGVSLDSTKRKRRRKMNRHQYKKRKKLERQRNSSATKKVHIS